MAVSHVFEATDFLSYPGEISGDSQCNQYRFHWKYSLEHLANIGCGE